MIGVGLTYLSLGLVLSMLNRNEKFKSGSMGRTALLFTMIGSLNIAIYTAGFFLPFFKEWGTILSGVSVIIFVLLVLMESNKDYRKFRDRMDELERKLNEFDKK